MDIKSISLKGKTDIADYIVIATGTSGRHAVSCAEKLVIDLKNNGITGVEIEGKEAGEWVLIDIWDVIVHVFQHEFREKYDIEKMWDMPLEKKAARKEKATKSKTVKNKN